MFEKKPYIDVRGIGKINCKPELSMQDVVMISKLASSLPFDDVSDQNQPDVIHKEFNPELVEFSIYAAIIYYATDYNAQERDVWSDLHSTSLMEAIDAYYANYMCEIYAGVTERVRVESLRLEPANASAVFGEVAKSLAGVRLEDVLQFAKSVSEMDGKDIVKAAVEIEAP